jgi:hypothetical protein
MADLERGALPSPIASLATRTCWATFPVRSASIPMFLAASPSPFVVARPVPRLGKWIPEIPFFFVRVRATPAATPASPVPIAISGVLSFFAVDVTALPAAFAPFVVAFLAASRVPF